MAIADSGPRSPSRFFGFRWAYVLLAAIFWFFLISLLFFPNDGTYDNWLQSTNLLIYALTGDGEYSEMRLHGVFGMMLPAYNWAELFTDRFFSPSNIASAVTVFCLLILIALYVIPESGDTKNLPATRGLHLRCKVVSALMVGLGMTALIAGLLDIFELQDELIDVFDEYGMISISNPTSPWSYIDQIYMPGYGIAKPVSWGTTLAGVFGFGLVVWLAMTFIPLGRDRYWQAERWTLIFTLLGLALATFGLCGMIFRDAWYSRHAGMEIFLGGYYTTWVVGLVMLTWAWSCRTAMFMMAKRYENAAIETDEPSCFACGYDLRMLASDKCPECGTQVNAKLLAKIKERQQQLSQTQAESRSTTR
jgi:hypothetical protein